MVFEKEDDERKGKKYKMKAEEEKEEKVEKYKEKND